MLETSGQISLFLKSILLFPFLHIIMGKDWKKETPHVRAVLSSFSWFYTPFIRIIFWVIKSDWFYKNPLRYLFPALGRWMVVNLFYAGEIYTLQELEALFDRIYRKNEYHINVSPCICRHSTGNYEEGKPVLSCMHLQVVSETFVELVPHGYPISSDTAIALTRKWDKQGFVHIMYGLCPSQPVHNWAKQIAICACHDHCIIIQSIKKRGAQGFAAAKKGRSIARVVEDKCVGAEKCGACVKRCVFEAVRVTEDGKIKIYEPRCYGCGLCVTGCPRGGMELVPREGGRYAFVSPAILYGKEGQEKKARGKEQRA
jgi:ferredoxin